MLNLKIKRDKGEKKEDGQRFLINKNRSYLFKV